MSLIDSLWEARQLIDQVLLEGALALIQNDITRCLPTYTVFCVMHQLQSFSYALCMYHDPNPNTPTQEDQEPTSQAIETWQTCHARFVLRPANQQLSLQASQQCSRLSATAKLGQQRKILCPDGLPQAQLLEVECAHDPITELMRDQKVFRQQVQKKVMVKALQLKKEHDKQLKRIKEVHDSLQGKPYTFDYDGSTILQKTNHKLNDSFLGLHVGVNVPSECDERKPPSEPIEVVQVAPIPPPQRASILKPVGSLEIREYLKDFLATPAPYITKPRFMHAQTAKNTKMFMLPYVTNTITTILQDDKSKSFEQLNKGEYEKLLEQETMALRMARNYHNQLKTVVPAQQQQQRIIHTKADRSLDLPPPSTSFMTPLSRNTQRSTTNKFRSQQTKRQWRVRSLHKDASFEQPRPIF